MASQAEKEAMHRGLRPSEVIRDAELEKQYDMPPKKKSFPQKAEEAMEDEMERRKAAKKKSSGPMMFERGGKVKRYAEGQEVKSDFPDQSAEARKKRFEMPADEYGKMVDKTMGVSKGGKKGDFNEEPDTAPKKTKKYAKGGSVSSASKRADGCAVKGKTKGRMV
jgi:hypothetical protein